MPVKIKSALVMHETSRTSDLLKVFIQEEETMIYTFFPVAKSSHVKIRHFHNHFLLEEKTAHQKQITFNNINIYFKKISGCKYFQNSVLHRHCLLEYYI